MDNVVSLCNRGFLVKDGVDLTNIEIESFLDYLDSLDEKPFIIDEDVVNKFLEKDNFFNRNLNKEVEVTVSNLPIRDKGLSSVEVVKNYSNVYKTRNMNEWFNFYLNRFNKMKDILLKRIELKNAVSISSIKKMSGRNEVATIGLISDIRTTKSNNYMITIEDPTDTITVFIKADNAQIVSKCQDLVLDEAIGVVGSYNSNLLYVKELVTLDLPDRPMKYSPYDEYACFIADTHVGSIDFEKAMYDKFVKWLKGEVGTQQQKEVAKKVKYLFIIGDLVDGVGVYPNQEKELEIKDIYKQYEVFSDYLKDLPEDIQLIVIPGNHDAVRQNEPQPPLFKDIAKPVYELSNVRNLSNPSMVNIGKGPNFDGFNVLMYHGFSYTYYASTIQKFLNVGMDKPHLVGEFLLKKHHLGPTHSSTLITPEAVDPMVIDVIPDIFVTGHIHKLGYKMYKSVNILATSCFQRMTSYMQKLGHHPTPGYVPLINLHTRNVKVMNFT